MKKKRKRILKIKNEINIFYCTFTEGNQGIEEEISREKVNYCNSLRAL